MRKPTQVRILFPSHNDPKQNLPEEKGSKRHPPSLSQRPGLLPGRSWAMLKIKEVSISPLMFSSLPRTWLHRTWLPKACKWRQASDSCWPKRRALAERGEERTAQKWYWQGPLCNLLIQHQTRRNKEPDAVGQRNMPPVLSRDTSRETFQTWAGDEDSAANAPESEQKESFRINHSPCLWNLTKSHKAHHARRKRENTAYTRMGTSFFRLQGRVHL